MERKDLAEYETLVFDCDGVVFNSNKIKTAAFYTVTKDFGSHAAKSLVEYHLQNGGVSRYEKFIFFITKILKKKVDQVQLNSLLLNFAKAVRVGLMECEIAEGLDRLREETKHAKWLLVTGGDQAEVRDIFFARGLTYLFDGGIFGSPDPKDVILNREISRKNIIKPCIFLGDSKYDFQVSAREGLDFIFLSKWTEVEDWQDFITHKKIPQYNSLIELLSQ